MVLFLPTELSLEKLRHRLSLFFRRLAAVVLLFFTRGFTCLHSCLTNERASCGDLLVSIGHMKRIVAAFDSCGFFLRDHLIWF